MTLILVIELLFLSKVGKAPWWSCNFNFPCVEPASYLGCIPESHDLPNIMNQTHQLEPVCGGTVKTPIYQHYVEYMLVSFCVSEPLPLPLSGCAWRMPSAVWKAWKEFGKSTSGSDSSTSWSRDMMASIIAISVWLQLVHSECCRKVRVTSLPGMLSLSNLRASENP